VPPERCCTEACQYGLVAIRLYRHIRRLALGNGLDPTQDAWRLVPPGEGHHDDSCDTEQLRWCERLSELARAEAAGAVTDEEVATFLCPFGVIA
jgi:hypothetical protein